MALDRNNVAHAVVAAALAAACGSSHGRDRADAGPASDGGGTGTDAAMRDGGLRLDAGGGVPDCEADDARPVTCPPAGCDGPPRWFWNGDDCFWIGCGECEGAACSAGYGSSEECFRAHAACEPALCRGSGGTWLWWTEECDHYRCGRGQPVDCLLGHPVCDCGAGRSYAAGEGCFEDTACAIPDPAPPVLCAASGGVWTESICCPPECGAPCPAFCDAPACDCGPERVWDDARGCAESARCHEREAAETCGGEVRCAEGTICCRRCGGAGCPDPATCIAPVCDDDPVVDECGNDPRVP
jgi:hypothetical protein